LALEIAVDLHAHSVFAGGTQALKLSAEKVRSNRKKAINHLIKTNETMPLKGIDLIGTGDCQFRIWTDILKEVLIEEKSGVFLLENYQNTYFLLQTEIIFTAPIKKKSKKIVHIIFLFPDFSSIETFRENLDRWEVKHEKMARPFITCSSSNQVSDRMNTLLDINPWIEAIPAHIMTPQGIFGSNIRINKLEDFFGESTKRLKVFETGLSADPEFLGLIPELDNKVLISNSDAHSSALHRMGREFSVLDVPQITYSNIISALRNNKVTFTAEFPPEEGRFFLTGHRPGRKSPGKHNDNEYCYFSPQHVPSGDICPICKKPLTIGVFQRCVEISKTQGANRKLSELKHQRNFIRMVPLIEIICHELKIKTKTAKSAISKYRLIVENIGPELNLWKLSSDDVKNQLDGKIESSLLKAICHVKTGNFTFRPYGYDGIYGSLTIGKRDNFEDIKVINTSRPVQQTL
jgi:PHP family Zn ribbon phosphoesterase